MTEIRCNDPVWAPYVARFSRGEWRAPIFRDMILAEFADNARAKTFLDIGCGNGFDGDPHLQRELAQRCETYIGVEPDGDVQTGPWFDHVHRCTFERAPIAPGSIHCAWSVMVLEHVRDPGAFWTKLWDVMHNGGIFWAFTVDSRHWFAKVACWLRRLRLHGLYLRVLHSQIGAGYFEHYRAWYRANSPAQVKPFVEQFTRCDFISFGQIGQINWYLPRWAHAMACRLDASSLSRGRPGANLAVRLQK